MKNTPSDTKENAQELKIDKGTTAAFGVLFVLPIVVILFCLAFLFPYMMRTMMPEEDATGATVNSGPNASQLPPRR